MYSLSYEIIIVEKESTNSHVLFDTYTIVGPSIDGPGDEGGGMLGPSIGGHGEQRALGAA